MAMASASNIGRTSTQMHECSDRELTDAELDQITAGTTPSIPNSPAGAPHLRQTGGQLHYAERRQSAMTSTCRGLVGTPAAALRRRTATCNNCFMLSRARRKLMSKGQTDTINTSAMKQQGCEQTRELTDNELALVLGGQTVSLLRGLNSGDRKGGRYL